MTSSSQISTLLCNWLSALSTNRRNFTPLNYSILHDLAHAKLFSLSHRPDVNILKNRPNAAEEYPSNYSHFIGINTSSNILVLCQNLNDNYVFPVLQFLNSEYFKCNYMRSQISFEFVSLDVQRFKNKHQSRIETYLANSVLPAQNIAVKYTNINEFQSQWMPSSNYFDNVFEIPSQIIPVIDVDLEDSRVLSDIISSNLVVYEFALNYLSKNKTSLVITSNDQWYPTSPIFSAACDLSIPTILTYHGTMPKFAEFTFADKIYYYDPLYYAKGIMSSKPRFVNFEQPLDIFISNAKNLEPLTLLQKQSNGLRQGTLGIVCALNGDEIYGISDYKKSFEDIVDSVCYVKSKLDVSLHSIVLRSHPHQTDSTRRILKNSCDKLRTLDVELFIDNSNSFLEFVSRCGPLASCPSTALDSLIQYNYPILLSATSELMNVVFGKQLYENCDIPICSSADEIVRVLKIWF